MVNCANLNVLSTVGAACVQQEMCKNNLSPVGAAQIFGDRAAPTEPGSFFAMQFYKQAAPMELNLAKKPPGILEYAAAAWLSVKTGAFTFWQSFA